MPTFIEYDKTTMKTTRVVVSKEKPADAAHIAYIELPASLEEVDLSLGLNEILALVSQATEQTPLFKWNEPVPEAKAAAVEEDFLDA